MDVILTVSLQELDWICCGLALLRNDYVDHPPTALLLLRSRLEELAWKEHQFPPSGARDPDEL